MVSKASENEVTVGVAADVLASASACRMASMVPTPTWRQLIMSSRVVPASAPAWVHSWRSKALAARSGQLQQPQIKVGGKPGKDLTDGPMRQPLHGQLGDLGNDPPPRDNVGIVDGLLPPRCALPTPLHGALEPRKRVEPGARSHIVEVEREVLSHAVVIPLQDLRLFLPFGTDRSILVYLLVIGVGFPAPTAHRQE